MTEILLLAALLALLLLALQPAHRRARRNPRGIDDDRIAGELRAAEQHRGRPFPT